MRVGLHPEARAEFRSAALWYEERRDGLGVEFVAAVDAALLRIGKAPKSFPQWVGTEQAPAVIRKASGVHSRRRKLFLRPAVPGSTLLAWARSREPVKRTPLLMRNRQDNSMTLVFLERDNV
ncbi:MAG: hypothetical protein DMG97_32165 [Acidobacteria bacterium]|nr:MAG: hypothetical protein DMG97_32165 [Acidobacteriota bacterium]